MKGLMINENEGREEEGDEKEEKENMENDIFIEMLRSEERMVNKMIEMRKSNIVEDWKKGIGVIKLIIGNIDEKRFNIDEIENLLGKIVERKMVEIEDFKMKIEEGNEVIDVDIGNRIEGKDEFEIGL